MNIGDTASIPMLTVDSNGVELFGVNFIFRRKRSCVISCYLSFEYTDGNVSGLDSKECETVL